MNDRSVLTFSFFTMNCFEFVSMGRERGYVPKFTVVHSMGGIVKKFDFFCRFKFGNKMIHTSELASYLT